MASMDDTLKALAVIRAEMSFLKKLLGDEVVVFGEYFKEMQAMPNVRPDVLQFWLKTGIRLMLPQIESMLNAAKKVALAAGVVAPTPLSDGDIAMLREETYGLTDKGVTKSQTAKITLTDNVRFTIRIYKEHFGGTHEIDLSGAEWQSFQRAIKVREKLMHPKSSQDIVVSKQEYDNVVMSWEWFAAQVGQLIQTAAQNLKNS